MRKFCNHVIVLKTNRFLRDHHKGVKHKKKKRSVNLTSCSHSLSISFNRTTAPTRLISTVSSALTSLTDLPSFMTLFHISSRSSSLKTGWLTKFLFKGNGTKSLIVSDGIPLSDPRSSSESDFVAGALLGSFDLASSSSSSLAPLQQRLPRLSSAARWHCRHPDNSLIR